jgi:hypothetical protein
VNDRSSDYLASIDASLRQMLAILEIAFADDLRDSFTAVLGDAKKELVYQNSFGGNSSRQVASLSGVSDRTVRDWWHEWSRLGLMEETETEGRYQRKLDLRRIKGAEA